ncbi:MAG: flavin reductase family protein [Micromonospora sp.]
MPTLDPADNGVVELRPVDPDLFRCLLRRRASTETVITMPGLAGGRRLPSLPPVAVTAASLTPVSVEPPTISFRLDRRSARWRAAERAEHLGVHLIAPGGLLGRPAWTSGPFGVPLIEDAAGVLLCRVVRRIEVGDHTVVFGEPLALGEGEQGDYAVHHADHTVGLARW